MATEAVSPSPKGPWHHSTLFNAIVIGAVGFLAPGLWNAMSNLGAGGAQEPYLVNAANALVFSIMGILCLLGAPLSNRIGLPRTLFLGAVGYPVYSAGLYANNRYGTVWLVLVGAVCCGVSAGLFWASEGAVALGYPEHGKRGRYLNIWLWFRTGGPLVGGAIVLALNHDAAHARAKGKVGYQTYLVFIALQCVAAPLALLLSAPEKVWRSDGSKVVIRREPSIAAECRALWASCGRRDVLLLLPVFWAAYFNQYSGNFQTYYFGVRARALVGFASNFGTLLSSQLVSALLDYRGLAVKRRVEIGFWWVVVWHVVAWTYGWVVQEKYTRDPPAYDWEDRGFVEGFFVLILWEFARQALQNWLYYLVACKTDNISDLTRLSGILRGQESFAQAVSFGLNTKKWVGGRVPLAVNTILLFLAAFPTWLVVRDLVPVEKDSTRHSDNEGQAEEGLSGPQVLNSDEKRKFAVGQTSAGADAAI
ncbi:MFS general substrate transporter [Annulohypoxylon truncatum]|uniref:MFS general substrate transporter n=1 Tax=Annulohypoxylon truncatum TaxID=327061 RepID=UPI0020074EE3|nr:MFS general substrate transporter [Annulohypoxylon truncatum]KAI1204733.1 MFS general substrate transporter [Annulohypoxylon truncatum]